jgi:glutathione peroxidase-family protein
METLETLRDDCAESEEELFWDERRESLYDFKIASPDGSDSDILNKYEGKVTLVFNCAAGCGNVPQHAVLKALDERYADQPDFNIQAIVVDDFQCHGYEEFNNGLEAYGVKNELGLTPGEIAEQYVRDNYGVEYPFSELTNGRFDKHTYDPDWVPGKQYEQEMHPFWSEITGARGIPRDEQNLPHHYEASPWAAIEQHEDRSQHGFSPIKGNFEKFLIDRTGRRFHRYYNGFLLGQRGRHGTEFPWWNADDGGGLMGWPSPLQSKGIEYSLNLISRDIDSLL